jgi:hypothetical protein
MARSWVRVAVAAMAVCATNVSLAQTPVPFPRPAQPAQPATPVPRPVTPAPPATPTPQIETGEPTDVTLRMPIYPGATYLTSYDAGRGQRYYLFGTNATFADIVAYYRTTLKQRGELVFEFPPVHMFDVGRFREETMAFPPGVTVKDYTWGGSQGFLNPKRGAEPARFKTIIQIVPASAGSER